MTHSQRLSDPVLYVWVGVQLDGQVLAAHCNCMAGLGECCSHVGATLFYLKTVHELVTGETCTSLPCSWIEPTSQKVEFAELTDIDFTAPNRKKQLAETPNEEPAAKRPRIHSGPPTEEERATFYKKVHDTGASSVVLTVVKPYADAYIPKSASTTLPKPLSSMFEEGNLQLDLGSLIAKSKQAILTLQVTAEQVN